MGILTITIILAAAAPYLMYRLAIADIRQTAHEQQMIEAFRNGQAVSIHYARASLSVTVALASLIASVPLIIIVALPPMREVSFWARHPVVLAVFLTLFLFWRLAWNALKHILTAKPAFVLSADALKIVDQDAEVPWSDIRSLHVETRRHNYMLIAFGERTFRIAFFIRSHRLLLRPAHYRDSNVFLTCLRMKIPAAPTFQQRLQSWASQLKSR